MPMGFVQIERELDRPRTFLKRSGWPGVYMRRTCYVLVGRLEA